MHFVEAFFCAILLVQWQSQVKYFQRFPTIPNIFNDKIKTFYMVR